MIKSNSFVWFAATTFFVLLRCSVIADGMAEREKYLSPVVDALKADWPKNHIVRIVCHGHSVPAGYFKTPAVHQFEAYPLVFNQKLAERYPTAVINVIVTAIGGENAKTGAERFEKDVLSLKPDVVTIDYALNDRRIGLKAAREAWVLMIQKAKAANVKVILLTPTPDLSAKLDDTNDPLNLHAQQIRDLAGEYKVGLVDSLGVFKKFVADGGKLQDAMSQGNHPNAKGHQMVAGALLEWFGK